MCAVPCQLVAALRLRSGRSSLRSVHRTARSCIAGPLFTLDQDRLCLHLGQEPSGEAAQLLGIVRQGQGVIEHGRSLSHGIPCGNPVVAERSDYPAASGRQVRSGIRQSIPSSSMDNCAGVSATLPSLAEGQTNRPFSSRFTSCHWSAIGPSDNGDAGALTVPPDHLHEVAPATTEHEEMPGERVLLQHRLGLRRERRKAFAHVGDPRRKPDPRIDWYRDHAVSPRISRAKASGSWPPLIHIR